MHWARVGADLREGLDFVAKRYILSLVEMNLIHAARIQVTACNVDYVQYLKEQEATAHM
jgi:hypothetical protein